MNWNQVQELEKQLMQNIVDTAMARNKMIVTSGGSIGYSADSTVYVGISITAVMTGTSSWSRNYTGKFRIYVGSYGNRRRFGDKKINELVDYLKDAYEHTKAREQREAERKRMSAMSEKMTNAVREQYQGVNSVYSVVACNNVGTIDITLRDVSKGQAKQLLDLALELGIIKKKE